MRHSCRFMSQVTWASSTTWFWTPESSDSSPLAFGRTRIWIRECDLCFFYTLLIHMLSAWTKFFLHIAALRAFFCFRYGFLAVFASTDGGITRVFPNVWVKFISAIKTMVLLVNTFWWNKSNFPCYVTERQSYGMRIPNPSIQTTTDAAWTTKVTSSDPRSDLVRIRACW